MLLYSLPSNVGNFCCAIESWDAILKPEALPIKIIEESNACQHGGRQSGDSGALMADIFEKKKKN